MAQFLWHVTTLALLLTCVAAGSEGNVSQCEGGDGTCPSDDSKDMAAFLQTPRSLHQLERGAGEPTTGFVMIGGSKPRRRAPVPKRKAKHMTKGACADLDHVIEALKPVSYARSFSQFVCHDDIREHLQDLNGGCLYLPSNVHVDRFFQKVEGANPWHFIDMLEDSFFPFNGTKCPTDVKGATVMTSEGFEVKTCEKGSGFVGVNRECIKAELLQHTAASGSNLKVYMLDGMMGLDPIWEHLMSAAGDKAAVRESLLAENAAQASSMSKKSESAKPSWIDLKFYVCDPGDGSVDESVTKKQIMKSVKVLNAGFRGAGTCKGRKAYKPGNEDTTLRFKYKSTERLTSSLCAMDCADNVPELTEKIVPREDGTVKVLICNTDLLGMASFPGWPDEARILLISPGSMPGGATTNYNEGDTLTHEMGHYVGLYHTFQGGCGSGDLVDDTNDEESPYYGCPTARPPKSCGKQIRPLHNFMDYSDDRCMCTFTKNQKERIVDQLTRFQPDLL